MININYFAALIAATFTAGFVHAGTFGFEDVAASNIPTNTEALQTSSDGNFGSYTTSSGGVSASLEYIFNYDTSEFSMFWSGGFVSNQQGNDATDFIKDLQSIKGGASTGNNFGVLLLQGGDPYTWAPKKLSGDKDFGDAFCTAPFDAFPQPASLVVDSNVAFDSIDVSLTAYTASVLKNGNSSTGTVNGGTYNAETNPYISMANTDGFYAVRIYGLLDDTGTLTEKYAQKILASSESGNIAMISDWCTVDLTELNAEAPDGLKGLTFQLISNYGNFMGMTMPSYIAIDNVNFAVPEPADIAAILALIAACVALRRKNISSR